MKILPSMIISLIIATALCITSEEVERIIDPIVDFSTNIFDEFYLKNKTDLLRSTELTYPGKNMCPLCDSTDIKPIIRAFTIELYEKKMMDDLPLFFAFLAFNSCGLRACHCYEWQYRTDGWNFAKFINYHIRLVLYISNSNSSFCKQSVFIFSRLNNKLLSINDRIINLLNNSYPLAYSEIEGYLQQVYNNLDKNTILGTAFRKKLIYQAPLKYLYSFIDQYHKDESNKYLKDFVNEHMCRNQGKNILTHLIGVLREIQVGKIKEIVKNFDAVKKIIEGN